MADDQAGFMTTAGAISPELQAALARWSAREGLELCVLFGSRATGQARPDSDHDLALSPAPAPLRRLGWQVELEDLVGGAASVVALSPETEPVLGWEIARTGQLIYEAQPGRWAAEQARLWHRYNDALPFRRGLAAALRRYAEEVLGEQ
jgi:predicted nucleotidyltransferase